MIRMYDNFSISPISELKPTTVKVDFNYKRIFVYKKIKGIDLYSFFKNYWKDDNEAIKWQFPLIAIDRQTFELVKPWIFADKMSENCITECAIQESI